MTTRHQVVSHNQWLAARREFLAREKEFTRLRDELSAARRALPWEVVDKAYAFDGPRGRVALAELFDGRTQLLVYHFMFGPDWNAGCPSCSFWADNFNGIPAHLNHRDVSFVAVSRAPLPKLQAYARRLGWTFPWYSSFGGDFNFDYGVSFTPEQLARGETTYNYATMKNSDMSEREGASVFFRDGDGAVYHTYSCYARGIDMLNSAYHWLDLAPKGRDEAQLQYTQAWVRRHDEYGT